VAPCEQHERPDLRGYGFDPLPFKDAGTDSTPFEQETLTALYPTHGIYQAMVAAVAHGNLAAGYITRHAAQQTIRGAAKSDIGR
jgi:hypothetical protein